MIRFVGIDPAAEKILVLKSSIHYRAAFEPLARAILEVDAPGCRRRTWGGSRSRACGGRSFRSRSSRPEREMAAAAFNAGDFKVFDVGGFKPRMSEIRGRIRPKLEAIGHSLAPAVSRATGGPAFAHVARACPPHRQPARRHLGGVLRRRRGYKKHCHFKVAVSRHCVRFLVRGRARARGEEEVGERVEAQRLQARPVLRRVRGLAGSRTSTTRTRPAAGRLYARPARRARRRARAHARRPARARPGGARRGSGTLDRGPVPPAALETFRTLAPLYRLRS
jgi:hypothetical protein